jgi:hypothetical protein
LMVIMHRLMRHLISTHPHLHVWRSAVMHRTVWHAHILAAIQRIESIQVVSIIEGQVAI